MKVYVHAWEYVNPGPEAGGGGFDWYKEERYAKVGYERGVSNASPDWALFFFTFETNGRSPEGVTKAIDAQLHDLCAAATVRHVGANVLAYWNANGMKMGQS